MSVSNHCFFGSSKCPIGAPVHAVGLAMIACSLALSAKAIAKAPKKDSGVKMPLHFDFLGRPGFYVPTCVGALIYPTLVILQCGAECGYGKLKEAAAKKTSSTDCPISCNARVGIQLLFGASLITLFAQGVATRIVVDKKTPLEVEVDNLHAANNKPYILAKWKVIVPLAVAFFPTAAAVVCKYLHKK